jgi:hypothetical protein
MCPTLENAMDPQSAWNNLTTDYRQREWPEVEHLAIDLLEWLLRGGFPPNTGGERTSRQEHADAARDFCIHSYAAAMDEQRRQSSVARELAQNSS